MSGGSATRSARRTVSLWSCVGAGVVITATAAAVLGWMGRTPFSKSGLIDLWSADAWGPENSQQLFDPYTLTHITHGLLIYGLLWLIARRLSLPARGILAVALEACWEVYENTDAVIERYRAATMAFGYYGDSICNSVGDIIACLIGFALAAGLPVRATLALGIGLELVLTVWIRDSLVLNVVMLLYPIEAVKTWQLGAG